MEATPWERVGPGTPGGRLLRRWWQPVYRSSDLVAGRALGIRVMGEDLALWRSASGVPGLARARCPHRGTALWLGRVRGETLECMHHGWRFSPGGGCTLRPGEPPGDPDPAPGAFDLVSYPLAERLGLIFAWMGEGEPPPPPRFPAWEAPGVLRVLAPEVWPCGFFQRLENSCDFAHLPYAHALSGVGAMAQGLAPPAAEETAFGATVTAPGLPPVHLLMPNALVFPTPIAPEVGWRDHLVWRVPLDDHRCASFSAALVPDGVAGAERFRVDGPLEHPFGPSPATRLGAQVLAGQQTLEALSGQPSLTEVEDYVALVGQGRPGERGPERLGRMDAPVRLLRRLWRRAAAAPETSGQPWPDPPATLWP